MKSEVVFADSKVKKAFESLKNSDTEDRRLYEFLNRAMDDISENAFCGVQIPKRQIPKEYIRKYRIDIYGNMTSPMLGGLCTLLQRKKSLLYPS